MKYCVGCDTTKALTEFGKRKDSKDGYRNYCKTCVKNPPKGNSRKVKSSIGDRFGSWTIKERSAPKADGTVRWLCECVCGNTQVIPGYTLRMGTSVSCGCTRAEKMKATRNPETLIRNSYRNYQHGATYKWRQFKFELTYEEFRSIVHKPCEYCGDAPYDKKYFYSTKHGKDKDFFVVLNGIDRVDNTLGYTVNNTVPCCKMCNQMKLDYGLNTFFERITKIYNNRISHEKVSDDS